MVSNIEMFKDIDKFESFFLINRLIKIIKNGKWLVLLHNMLGMPFS